VSAKNLDVSLSIAHLGNMLAFLAADLRRNLATPPSSRHAAMMVMP
jgi:hypothetical protein